MIDLQKKEAKQFCKFYAKEIEKIILPLQKAMEIDTIIYSIFYPKDKTAFFISNNFLIIKDIIDIGYFGEEFNKILFSAKLDGQIKKFLWPAKPDSSDKIGTVFRKHGLTAGITFIFCQNNNVIMNVGFASSQRDDSILNIFVNNTSILFEFIKYFECEAAHIIKHRDKKRFLFYKKTRDEVEFLQERKLEKLLNLMLINKFFISSIDDPLRKFLTKREYECAQLLSEGKSFKQISNVLDISTRTVEAHINRCKIKFSVSNKFQVAQKIKNIKI